jgi:8-oxo-dGTP pyrophosphatase MutT (NUDIX family)
MEKIPELKFEGEPKIIINALIIREGRLLLVKKKDVWILPGGKLEKGESDLKCLKRELKEELSSSIQLVSSVFLKKFRGGRAPHSGYEVLVKAYLSEITGTPSADGRYDSVNEIAWVNNFQEYDLSETTEKIIVFLQKNNIL